MAPVAKTAAAAFLIFINFIVITWSKEKGRKKSQRLFSSSDLLGKQHDHAIPLFPFFFLFYILGHIKRFGDLKHASPNRIFTPPLSSEQCSGGFKGMCFISPSLLALLTQQ